MTMSMRIRVTTTADLFEKRKQEHIERGYRIEDERPIPVNGFCSFVAVRELSVSDKLTDLVAEVLNGDHAARGGWEVLDVAQNPVSLRESVHVILATTLNAMDTHPTASVKDVS